MMAGRQWRSVGAVGVVLALMLGACSSHAKGPVTVGHDAAIKPLAHVPSGGDVVASWAPWPSALHDARHSGMSTSAGPTKGVVRWRRKLEGAVTPGPVIGQDGTIYAASNAGVLHALDPATGADRWTYDSQHTGGYDLSVSPLILPDGTILYSTPGSELVALSPQGHLLWTQVLPGPPTSPVTVDGHRVYVGDTSGSVSALDVSATSHDLAWTVSVGSSSFGSVVTDGSGRVYTTSGSALVAIDDHGTTGTVAWRKDPGDSITEVSAGLAANGTVLLGTNGKREWAYHRDGSPAWNAQHYISYSSPAVTASGLAYVGDHHGLVNVYDVRTGSKLATYYVAKTLIYSSTVIDRDYRVYFAGQNGHAYGVDAKGTLLFDVNLGAQVDDYPALSADGALIIGSRNGMLTAIG